MAKVLKYPKQPKLLKYRRKPKNSSHSSVLERYLAHVAETNVKNNQRMREYDAKCREVDNERNKRKSLMVKVSGIGSGSHKYGLKKKATKRNPAAHKAPRKKTTKRRR